MPIRILLTLAVAACLGWYFVPSSEADSSTAAKSLPLRSEMVEKSWSRDTCLIVYPSGPLATTYEEALMPLLAGTYRRGPKIRVLSADQLTPSLIQDYPLLYLSRGQAPLPLRPLPDLRLKGGSLYLGGNAIEAPNQVATFSYLPGQGGQAVHLVYSPTDSSLLHFIKATLTPEWPRFLWRTWGYQVQTTAGDVAFQGYFNDSTWQMDGQLHYDYTDLPASLEPVAGLTVETWEDKPMDLRPFSSDYATVRAQIATDWNTKLRQTVNVTLYTSVEDKALRTQRMEVAHCTLSTGQVHIVENDYFRGMDWGEQYRPLLYEALGKPSYEALEMGLALHYRSSVRGQDWRSWARQLATANALVSPTQLQAREWQDYQPLLGLFSAAAWAEYLLDELGTADFQAYYQQGKLARSLPEMEAGWPAWIHTNYPPLARRAPPVPTKRLNGFTLAHEGYRVFNGYGGQQTAASLEKLRRLGTNAVSIVPYSYMRNPRRASSIPVMRDAGSENDAAVVHAHFQAQALGQFTLLKPQLWINGAWPGDVDFNSEEEWDTFFGYYRDWALHYALLADIYQFDAYCIGTELRHATLKQPTRWQALIQDVRQLYRGPLTYAANWGEECEQLSFWPSLDYIGVNNYYPLHRDSTASDRQLKAGAEAIMNRLRRLSKKHQRPVWLTEVGYRSASSPWIQPHAEAGKREIDAVAQARCYDALLSAMESERDWLRGMFWWKWPSYLSHNESNGRGYMPLRKPAAEVVQRYFR